MRTLRVALMALAGVGAHEARAQSPSAFESQATSMASGCFSAKNDTPDAANAAVAACGKLIGDLDGLRQTYPSLDGHDFNVFLVVSAMGETRIANSYGKIDGVRSARVCNGVERSWQLVAQMNKAHSPGYAAAIDNLVGSTVSSITKCRNEFGVPAGAAPLPPG